MGKGVREARKLGMGMSESHISWQAQLCVFPLVRITRHGMSEDSCTGNLGGDLNIALVPFYKHSSKDCFEDLSFTC
jgi:hypothetical protein